MPNDPKNTNPDDMPFDVRMSTPQERAESSKKPPEPSKGEGVSRPPCIMGTGKTINFSPTGSKPPPKNTPSSSKDSTMPIPRKLIAVVLFVWAAALIYPAWDVDGYWVSGRGTVTYPAARSFYWNPPLRPLDGPDGDRYSNPEINLVRTTIPAFSFTTVAIGIRLLCKNPSK